MFAADVLTSLPRVLTDLALSGCFFFSGKFLYDTGGESSNDSNSTGAINVTGISGKMRTTNDGRGYLQPQQEHHPRCSEMPVLKDIFIPLLQILPLWFRFWQNLRKYYSNQGKDGDDGTAMVAGGMDVSRTVDRTHGGQVTQMSLDDVTGESNGTQAGPAIDSNSDAGINDSTSNSDAGIDNSARNSDAGIDNSARNSDAGIDNSARNSDGVFFSCKDFHINDEEDSSIAPLLDLDHQSQTRHPTRPSLLAPLFKEKVHLQRVIPNSRASAGGDHASNGMCCCGCCSCCLRRGRHPHLTNAFKYFLSMSVVSLWWAQN